MLVILLGLAAAYFAWNTTSKAERLERRQAHRQRGDAYAQRLRDFVLNQTELLRFLQGWYRLEAAQDERRLHDLVGGLLDGDERYRSLRYLAWVERVPAGTLPAWEAQRGRSVHGVDGEPVSDEVDHYVVAQVHPDLPSQIVAGMDLGTDPVRREALEQAVERDCMVMSRPVTLVHPSPGGPSGVLVCLPVYIDPRAPRLPSRRREELAGMVIGVFSLNDLLQSAFQPLLESDVPPPVRVVVLEDGRMLGSAGPPVVPGDPLSSTDVALYERIWTVQTLPAEIQRLTVSELFERPSLLLPVSVFVVMVLCAWIVWTLNRRNLVIHQQVAQQTAEMRQKNMVLEGKERELNDANRRLLEMSNTDPLTGILNRRAFEVQLDKERERARRSGQAWGLLLFDVDHFKDYNDRYGHVAGDEVLRRVATILQNEARRIDTVARFGGEEFVVLTGGADAGGLLVLGERIRARIQEAGIPHEATAKGVVTVSAGGSLSTAAGGHDSRPVFEIADRCLYQAKSTGRNRIVMLT